MFDPALKHIRYGFDSPVRMPWKSRQVMLRITGTEIVEKKERVKLGHFIEPECPPEMDTGAFNRRFTLYDLADFSGFRHFIFPFQNILWGIMQKPQKTRHDSFSEKEV
jgi:hypothetical protein